MSKQVPFPPHPGSYLKEELEEREWTQRHFSKITGMPHCVVSQIINRGTKVNAARAIAIGKALGTGPEVWMNLQQAYDLWREGYRSE